MIKTPDEVGGRETGQLMGYCAEAKGFTKTRCSFIYTHKHTYIYTHTYRYIHIHTYIHPNIHIHT